MRDGCFYFKEGYLRLKPVFDDIHYLGCGRYGGAVLLKARRLVMIENCIHIVASIQVFFISGQHLEGCSSEKNPDSQIWRYHEKVKDYAVTFLARVRLIHTANSVIICQFFNNFISSLRTNRIRIFQNQTGAK